MTLSDFGTLPDGRVVQVATLSRGDLRVSVLTLGAILNDVQLAGVAHGLTLGAAVLPPYLNGMGYHGAIVGPVANRIAGAQARIGDETCHFAANEGETLLHGGSAGTHARLWQIGTQGAAMLELTCDLADGEGGFPGNRRISARFSLADTATLDLRITASSDAPTLLNLANHSYWNLDGSADYSGHRLTVHAERYLPVDPILLPTGQVAPVAGTPFDFRAARVLTPRTGARIDHNFCLAAERGPLRPAVELVGARGVRLRIGTTEPGLQIFDGGNAAAAAFTGHAGHRMGVFSGLALEAQGWPDAPHHPGFPPILHGPDAPYRQHTRFIFDRV